MPTILLAEDEYDLKTVVASILSLEGYQVITCSDGRDAWERLQQQPVDVLMTDWLMPFMDGMELIKTLRADARFRSLPVILASAANPHGWEEFQLTTFLRKPYSIWHVLETLNAATSGQDRHASPTTHH